MPEQIIADTSVLIALEKIDLLHILCKIYKEILLPEAVVKEFGNINIACHSVRKVESRLISTLMQDLNLGRGESEVIALAYETNCNALIDDLKARKVAEKLGIIDSALNKVQELKDKGFHISNELLAEISRHSCKN